MAGDVKVKYESTGFERVNRELADLEKTGRGSRDWFNPMGTSLKDAETAGISFTSKLSSGLKSIGDGAVHVVGQLVKVAAGVTAVAGVIGGAAAIAFASWSKGILTTTESFRMLEISLYGALKSWEPVKTVSEFAKKYSAEYPAMYKDVMQTIQSMAYMPSMKPMIMAGDVKLMKEAMDIVQGLATMRPEQGVQGATFALREALSGNWRSLQMRFDIPVESIARSAGMTMEQMKSKPEAGFQALGAFTKEFVGVDTMAMMAKNLGTQVDNLREKYTLWKESIGKAGFYDTVINYLLKLNETFENLLKSETLGRITKQISSFMESIADKIAGVFTKGIDWESIVNLGGLGEVLKQVGRNAIGELEKVWEVAKEPLAEVLKGVFKFVASAAGAAFKEALVPVIKQQLKEVADTFKSWDEKLREKMGVPSRLEAPEIPEYKGPRPWRKKVEKVEEVTPPEPGWTQKWVSGYQPPMPIKPVTATPEEQFQLYGAWSKMAGALAQAPAEEPRGWWSTVAGQYVRGKIPYEEYPKRRKLEEFQGLQMRGLEQITAMPEAGPELKAKAYGEMFNLSMGRGEFGKAETFMKKALEEMAIAMKKEAGYEQGNSKNLDTIAGNTTQMVSLIGEQNKNKEKPPESKSITPRYDTTLGDEIREEVRGGETWYTNL